MKILFIRHGETPVNVQNVIHRSQDDAGSVLQL